MNCKLSPLFPTVKVMVLLLRRYTNLALLPTLDTTKAAPDLEITFLLKCTLIHFYLLNLEILEFNLSNETAYGAYSQRTHSERNVKVFS